MKLLMKEVQMEIIIRLSGITILTGAELFIPVWDTLKNRIGSDYSLQHILGGIQYAMANGFLDYSKAYSVKAPEDNRFTKKVLSNDLNEPMELIVAPDGRVFFTERAGNFICMIHLQTAQNCFMISL